MNGTGKVERQLLGWSDCMSIKNYAMMGVRSVESRYLMTNEVKQRCFEVLPCVLSRCFFSSADVRDGRSLLRISVLVPVFDERKILGFVLPSPGEAELKGPSLG